jgi:hypothetical protein
MGLYAADGSWNVTVVDGTAVTGLYAADGSMNVAVSEGTSPVGLTHPCGARWVTVATSGVVGFYAPDGSMYVSETGTPEGAQKVTVVSGGLGVVEIPEDLGWTPTWSITSSGDTYTISNLDFDDLKPTPAFIYYCSPTGSAVNSPTNDNSADPITPRRFVTLANANGGIVEARIAGGVYYGNIGFDGNNFTCAGVVLSLWEGQQAAGRPVFVKRGTNLIAPWTADVGATYFTAHSVANTTVFDLLYRDAGGIPTRLTAAVDLTTCRATPGTYFFDSGASRMYVTAQDSRVLTGSTTMIVPTAGNVFQYTPIIDAQLWMDGIDFIGPTLGSVATANKRLTWNARDVGYIGGTNGLALTGPVDAINLSPRVGGGNSDGLNYHGNAQGDGTALEYDLRSIRSGYDASAANNASTAHENCVVISVAGDYAGSQDRVIHDINSAKRFMVGSTIRESAGTGATSITMQAGTGGGTAAEIWLDDCTIEDSTTGGLFADAGCAIRYRNMSIAGLTTGGTGTIEAFV